MIHCAVGGYFELELPPPVSMPYPGALTFQSARGAFMALLAAGAPRHVWMPRYTCDVMLHTLDQAGVSYSFYGLNNDLTIKDDIVLLDDEWLIYVNYFGLCTAIQQEILRRFNPLQVVFDNAQAFFCPPLECLATLYSPRKFFGIPDGGLLVTSLNMSASYATDETSLQRSSHLLQRLGAGAEAGYQAYQRAEQSLDGGVVPKRMSLLTTRLLSSIDVYEARKRRDVNFGFLHSKFGAFNEMMIAEAFVQGALCYPLLVSCGEALRNELVNNRIYTARYWSDCHQRTDENSIERQMCDRLIAIPCDQRYGIGELQRVVDVVEREMARCKNIT